MVLLLAMMVLFLGGISVDLWRVLSDHREVAGIVDGAAIAGATAIDADALYADLPARLDASLARERVCSYLAEHAGVPAGQCPGPDVEVGIATDTVFVRYRRDVPLTLLRAVSVFGGDADPIRVSAEAEVTLLRGVP
jgi:hypothetical protein